MAFHSKEFYVYKGSSVSKGEVRVYQHPEDLKKTDCRFLTAHSTALASERGCLKLVLEAILKSRIAAY